MKRLTLALLAITYCFAPEGNALGQMQGCDCNAGGEQSAPIYQPTQWENCPSCNHHGDRRMKRQCDEQCRTSRCSRFASFWTRPLFPRCCAARCCATKAYPDAGWNPPAHMPVNYDGGWYGSYLPEHAYGTPGGKFVANYPTVYQPTDTTQLGYYYNKVPTWQTRYDMVPPTPIPSNFHSRICPPGGCGCRSGYGAGYAAPYGSSCQNCNREY